ncbi:hypothetical protein, partial [Stenotrophomonas sp. PSU-St19]
MLDCFSNGADQGRHLPEEVAERGSALQALSACRASSAPTENAACKGGIFVPVAWFPVDADLGRR